jgi:hypothetical protein
MLAQADAEAHFAAIPDRVERGYEWLGKIDPERHVQILPGEIKMWSNRWCVLGQYAHAFRFAGPNAPYQLLEAAGVDPGDQVFLQENGFACPIGWEHHADFLDLQSYYELLREAWVNILTHEPTRVLDTTPAHR